jgi:outer membrane protein OmpA-like peptidoglycan-associated protein/tetratricopeptide (TPR) repeat protein
MKKIAYIFILLFVTLGVSAQRRKEHKLKDDKKHDMAKYQIERGGYYGAIGHLEELVAKHPNNTTYALKLAEAYYKSRDYVRAEPLFLRVRDEDVKAKKFTIAGFHYAACLKHSGKYKEAQEAYEFFAKAPKFHDKEVQKLKPFAESEARACGAVLQKEDDKQYKVIHLGTNINCGYSDFAPRVKNDNTIIFSSLQEDSVIKYNHGEKHFKHVKIFQSSYQGAEWTAPIELEKVNSIFENNANGCFSPDKKFFYFSRCGHSNLNDPICHIYVSEVENGKLQKPKKLAGDINHIGVTSTQPFVTTSMVGKKETETMYFVSNRKGSTAGSLDIWYAVKDKNGVFSKAFNCGKQVNTQGDEITPFYDAVNSTLYFSSNYHEGFGGQDVFKIKGSTNKWESATPDNVGKSINSTYDDTYFTIAKIGDIEGFIVSNRPGGHFLTSETCCDDIYGFRKRLASDDIIEEKPKEEPQPTVAVVEKKEEIKPVEETVVIAAPTPDEKPKEEPKPVVKEEPKPIVKEEPKPVVKEEPKPVAKNVPTPPLDKKVEPKPVEKKEYAKLEGDFVLYFDFKKSVLDGDNALKLKEMTKKMVDNPTVKVKIEGHSDNIGSEQYNLTLSNERANLVRKYLIQNNFSPNRIIHTKGFGETRPVAPNELEGGRDNPEGRKQNRRVEVIFVNE